MKNIHLLPTEKPSRIRLGNNENFVIANFEQSSIRSKNDSYTNQHIYITSDKEIKEGDWLFANQGVNKIVEIKEGNYPYGSINNKGDKIFNSKHWKSKIILTTDQSLDGVQAIDDEFLEWFVKNPSCESVEVRYEVLRPFQSVDKGYKIHLPDNEVLGEPKQEQRKMIMEKLKQIGKELIALTALILCLILIPNPIMYLIGCWQLGSWFGYLTKKL